MNQYELDLLELGVRVTAHLILGEKIRVEPVQAVEALAVPRGRFTRGWVVDRRVPPDRPVTTIHLPSAQPLPTTQVAIMEVD